MTPDDTTITTQAELAEVWTALMQPLGFGDASIWLMLIGPDDRPIPHLVEIEGAARPATPEEVPGIAAFLAHLEAELPGARFAFLRARPGGPGLTHDDREWARRLHDAARLAGVTVELVHRACDVDLVPVPMDEVLATSA